MEKKKLKKLKKYIRDGGRRDTQGRRVEDKKQMKTNKPSKKHKELPEQHKKRRNTTSYI